MVCLEAALLRSLQELGNLVYRGSRAFPGIPPPSRMTVRVWEVARRIFLRPGRWLLYCPLWGNPNLSHFPLLPDPQLWAHFGVKTLRGIFSAGTLLLFPDL